MKTSIEQHLSIIAAREQLPPANAVAPTAADPYVEGTASGSTGPAMEQIEHNTSQALDASDDDVIMVLVDTFFHFCHNQPYSFFHEGTFRQHLAERNLPTHLLLAVMASAVRFCTHPQFFDCSKETSVAYADRAWRLILSDGLTGGRVAEVSNVQSIALLGLFDFTCRSRRTDCQELRTPANLT